MACEGDEVVPGRVRIFVSSFLDLSLLMLAGNESLEAAVLPLFVPGHHLHACTQGRGDRIAF